MDAQEQKDLPWTPPVHVLFDEVVNTDSPPAKRMRAMYYLRTLFEHSNEEDNEKKVESKTGVTRGEILRQLCTALGNKESSPLIRHELAYVLGQIRDERANATLAALVSDVSDDAMVRHESAEALGAIGSASSTDLLDRISTNEQEPIEVKETCKIAADFIRWKVNNRKGQMPAACACMLDPYSVTHDPAPAATAGKDLSVDEMQAVLLSEETDLFEKYRVMFALRNRGGDDAVKALGKVLAEDSTSALFRHEIAFVLGQMQNGAALDALETILRRSEEHHMVRHEAAEALGAIEGDESEMERCRTLLQEFAHDKDPVVGESCEVALDAQDYYGSFSSLKLGGAEASCG